MTDPGTSTGVVTILVTDQVGSTEMLARLGDDDADRVRRIHFLLLREALATHGGREVKHLGDGVMASFASPSAAVACAIAVQQAVERQNRRPGEPTVSVRIGVDVGEASTEDGDWFGTSVVVASRLCAAATGGAIVVSDLLRRLVGSRGGFDFGPAEPRHLKGLPQPVPACQVRWTPLARPSLGLPAELAGASPTTFIGRSPELERLSALWDVARSGRPRLALVSGEPGIGKSRLAQELARNLSAAGATVLFGRCEEESLSAYQPVVEPLRHYVLSCPADQLAAEVDGMEAELAQLVPEVARRLPAGSRPPDLDGAIDRYRVFEAAATLLREASRTAPVLVVLDDLQWAEKPALMLLRHLARHLEDARVMVLATCRDLQPGRGQALADLVADLRRDRLVEVTALGGLMEHDVAAMVHEVAGQRSAAGFVRAVHAATEGNPFFVESLVRHLAESGAPVAGAALDLGVGRLGLPDDVREVVSRRLSALGERGQRILAVASVIGRSFEMGVLQRVAGVPDDEVIEVLEESVAAKVLTEAADNVDRYAFAHALVREVLYDGLIGSRRVRLHRRVGAVLEALHEDDRGAHLAQIAYHFLEAVRDGDAGADGEKAVDYAYAAAEQALAVVAFEEAALLCERALRVLERRRQPDPGRRLDVLLLLGRAHCRSGDVDQARKAFGLATDAARDIGTATALSRAALVYGEIPGESGFVDERLVTVLDDALNVLPPGDDPRRVRLLARLAEELYYTHRRQRVLPLSQDALAMARRVQDPVALADALRVRRLSLFGPGALQERLAMSTELVALAEAAGGPQASLRARIARVVDLVEAGEVAAVDAEIEAVSFLAEQLRQPLWFWYPAKWRAMRALMEGRIEEGERLAEAALAVGQRPHGRAAYQAFIVQLVEVRRCQGRLHELEVSLEAGAEQYRAVPAWRCGLAWLYAELGRRDEARRELEALATHGFADLPTDFTWLTSVAVVGEVAAHLGDLERTTVLYDLLLPYAGRCLFLGGGDLFGGCVTRFLGLMATALGRWAEAEHHLQAAQVRHRELGARPDEARTEHALAELYLARREPGDTERAAAAVADCLTVADDLGMHALARRAITLL